MTPVPRRPESLQAARESACRFRLSADRGSSPHRLRCEIGDFDPTNQANWSVVLLGSH